jgi:integrase/recombinase XerC
MCSDMAIRSGTAVTLGPSHYDRAAGVLTFRTKYQNAQHLPVTAALRELLDTCTNPDLPFVSQLARGVGRNKHGEYPLKPLGRATDYHSLIGAFNRLKRSLGITRKLTPHDLRRTTARNVYEITHDLRTVQALLGHSDLNSTMWYLQDNLIDVPVSALELAKQRDGIETHTEHFYKGTETIQ